jgi:hypothetical protein
MDALLLFHAMDVIIADHPVNGLGCIMTADCGRVQGLEDAFVGLLPIQRIELIKDREIEYEQLML